MEITAFSPRGQNQTVPDGTASIAVTTAVQQITLPVDQGNPAGATVRLVCAGTQLVAWCWGAQSGLTASNGVPMLANSSEKFRIPPGVTQISVIAGATGSTMYATLGDGE